MSLTNLPSRAFLSVRHGPTDWNRDCRFQGRTDNPINDDGIALAFAIARRLRPVHIDQIVSSPLKRAAKTAEIIAAAPGIPLAIDDDLIALDYGSLEGQLVMEVMRAHDLKTVQDLLSIMPRDSEPWTHATERVLRCVGRWLDAHPEATILFVCHDIIMQVLSTALCRKWFNNRYGTPFRFAPTDQGWVIEEV